MSKPLRDTMPEVTAWIDELRAAFGRDSIDASIRTGLARGGFYATENGLTVGELEPEHDYVSAADMVLRKPTNEENTR